MGGFWLERGLDSQVIEEFISYVLEELKSLGVKQVKIIQAPKPYSEDADLINEYQRIRSNSVSDPNGYLNACHAMRALADGSLAVSLSCISCPTLVIAPELDPYCPPRASKMIADAIPAATMEVIEGAGHCVHMEASDTVNGLILKFIKEHA